MRVEQTILDGVLLITPRRYSDERGWFSETWNRAALCEAGLNLPDFVQDNQSFSAPRHTLRGMHCQLPPRAQDKLVRCLRGVILDVAVDARDGSPSFGQHFTVELSAENGAQMFIPKGFLHGFLTLTPDCEVLYKCSDYYAPDCDCAVHWNSLGIDWGTDAPVLSDKDAKATHFSDFDTPFAYRGNS